MQKIGGVDYQVILGLWYALAERVNFPIPMARHKKDAAYKFIHQFEDVIVNAFKQDPSTLTVDFYGCFFGWRLFGMRNARGRSINMKHVMSRRSIQTWLDESKTDIETKMWSGRKFLRDCGVDIAEFGGVVPRVLSDPLMLKQHEEDQKRVHWNQIPGLVHCFANTTLFNPKSTLCTSCMHRGNCVVTNGCKVSINLCSAKAGYSG